MDFAYLYSSFDGRINRQPYWIAAIVLAVILIIVGYYAAILLGLILLNGLTDVLGITGNPLDANALDYILGIATLVVSIWFLIELGFLRGTQGPNQYGPDPLGNP